MVYGLWFRVWCLMRVIECVGFGVGQQEFTVCSDDLHDVFTLREDTECDT